MEQNCALTAVENGEPAAARPGLPARAKGAALAALGRLKERRGRSEMGRKAGRYALRFFAAMLVLTLVARGAAGATMPRVTLTGAGQGTVVQRGEAAARVYARQGQNLPLPEGVTVQSLSASVGQQIAQGQPIALLDLDELQDKLAELKAQRQGQQAQLARLTAEVDPGDGGLAAARQGLDRANEDYDRAAGRAQAAVDTAAAERDKAKAERDAAHQALEKLDADPDASGEAKEAARQRLEEAEAGLSAAETGLSAARQSQSDSLLAARHSVENAQSALDSAAATGAQATQDAALTKQANDASAASLRLEMDKTAEQIELLEGLIRSGGLVAAPWDGQVLACTLAEGQPSAAGALRFSAKDSTMEASFTLPADQAVTISVGQAVTLTQGSARLEVTVASIGPEDENGDCHLTAAIPPDTGAAFRAGISAGAELVFSRTEYPTCLPAAAVRQDAEGAFVLVMDESRTAFGVSNTARRVPVTVLETSSDGQLAAVEGSLSGSVILSSDRPVSPGAAVRVDS